MGKEVKSPLNPQCSFKLNIKFAFGTVTKKKTNTPEITLCICDNA